MTSTAQERLSLNRLPLDNWTTREQLCLASAVSCSGDQNWMTVSRTLKLVCGNGTINRPSDWYSQKNCAVQYGHMLENVETPKRKKRTSEGASGVSSPAVVETPTDLILRRLNEERVQELKAEIRRGQEEFAQIYKDLKALQSGTLSEDDLREMLCNIELQQEQERVEEMKFENQMREREQQRMEIQRNWRTLAPVKPNTPPTAQANSTDTATVDMDEEDIIGLSSPQQSVNNSNSQSQQKQSSAQPGTSPLLSSLLKTPTSSTNVTTVSPNTTPGTARSSAPTITTLLTSGSIPNKNQPVITLKANIPPQKAAQLLTSPISGPPSITSVPGASITQQNLLSPSQAAPTLSMLLEKNKYSANATTNAENYVAGLSHKDNDDVSDQTQLPEISTASDSNNDEIPMDLDEEISSHVNDTYINKTNMNDSDDPDPNEEQQLMEVFKNIGNIDELDIDVSAVIDDEEVDFLKDMGADSPPEITEVAELENKEDIAENNLTTTTELIKNSDPDSIEVNEEENSKATNERTGTMLVVDNSITVNSTDNRSRKIETASSDDSNDNIPLAAVASLEQRAAQEKEKVDTSLKNECNRESNESNKIQDGNTQHSFDEEKEHDKLEKQLADLVGANDMDDPKNLGEDGKSPLASECSDVIVIPTDDDDSNGDKVKQNNEKSTVDEEAAKIKKDLETELDSIDDSKQSADHDDETAETEKAGTNLEAAASHPPIISIGDTDEDSSTTDVSIVTRKDEKMGASSFKHSAPQPRKSLHEATRQDHQNKTDDESTTQFSSSSSSSVTPARQPVLRKLRDRDRSESPMIDADLQPAINSANATALDNLSGQRLRRRYSSTPVNDGSIPNSPASSDRERDETETRVSKKSLLSIFHALQYSKNASTLQRCFHEDLQFDEICLRPLDMLSIRKQIEAGTIRNVSELQRDIMLMCENGLMLFKQNSTGFNAASSFMQECQSIREFVVNTNSTELVTQSKDNKEISKSLNTSGNSSRKSGSRKSQRIT